MNLSNNKISNSQVLDSEVLDSEVLDLESLNTKYTNLLIEYKQALSNYINFLKEEDPLTHITKGKSEVKQMTTIKGTTYWGKSALGVNNSSTLQECEASCANTNLCTGATFNQYDHGQPICWLRNGDGDILPGLENDYSIVLKEKNLLLIVQNINQQLIDINQQIQEKTQKGNSKYNSQIQERKIKNYELINQYTQLTTERNKIDKTINQYQTLDEEQNEGNLTINKNYFSFILLLFLVIFIIILLYNFTTPIQRNSILQSGGYMYG